MRFDPYLIRSYENKHYCTLRIINYKTAEITLYDIKYPLTVQYNSLKRRGMIAYNFIKQRKSRESLKCLFNIKELNVFDARELLTFINQHFQY